MATEAHDIGQKGPFAFVLTTTGNTSWVPIGPCLSNKVSATATFDGTTGIVKLQGCVSTGSTGTPVAVLSRTYAQRSTIITSTVATPIGFIRANSTSLQATKTIRVSVIVVP